MNKLPKSYYYSSATTYYKQKEKKKIYFSFFKVALISHREIFCFCFPWRLIIIFSDIIGSKHYRISISCNLTVERKNKQLFYFILSLNKLFTHNANIFPFFSTT